MNKKNMILLGILGIILLAIPLTVFLQQQQQDIRQRAAGNADLIVDSLQLTDAGGNVRTTFYPDEDIYIRVAIKNQGSERGESADNITLSQIYTNASTPVTFNTSSDISMYMRNGEFGAGTRYEYESRITGTGQNVFTSAPYSSTSARKYSWRKSAAGSYTARILLNSNKAVTETNYENNQATVNYSISPFSAEDEDGGATLSKPSDFDNWPCAERPAANFPGVTGCVQQIRDTTSNVRGRITNNTSNSITVALATYKAYLPYVASTCTKTECPAEWNWSWTQTFFRAKRYTLPAGKTVYLSTSVPSCTWQADVFVNAIPFSFHPLIDTYGGNIRYIDGWYHFYPNYTQSTAKYCTPVIPSPTPTSIPTPTFTPTPTRTPTPTSTPVPTNTPMPTATPVPQATKFNITAFMHGIGNSGDNANPNSFSLSNKNPVRQQRKAVVEIYDANNTLVLTKEGLLTYNTGSGNFTGVIDAGTTLTQGTYVAKVKSHQYLRKLFPGFFTVTPGDTVTLPTVTFVTGDVVTDNALNILDYNVIVGCYSDFAPPVSCSGTQKDDADLTDDGKVNQFDYNLFLRDLTVQNGE